MALVVLAVQSTAAVPQRCQGAPHSAIAGKELGKVELLAWLQLGQGSPECIVCTRAPGRRPRGSGAEAHWLRGGHASKGWLR